jgi:hypothetical protein
MRAARAAPVGRPATRGSKSPSCSERRITCGAVVGKPEGADAYRTSGAASLVGSASPAVAAPAGSGIRLSCPGPVARVPAAALPVEGRRSVCLAAGSTRRPRTRARARSGRRSTSPGWCPPARSQHTPFTGSAIRLRLPRVGRRTHPQPPGRDRGSTTTTAGLARSVVGRDFLQLTRGGAQPTMGILPRHRRSTGCYRAGGPPLPSGSGAGWHVLDADVGEPGRNHNGVPVGAAGVALGMIVVRPPGRPPQGKPEGAGDVDGVADREDRTGQTVGLGG